MTRKDDDSQAEPTPPVLRRSSAGNPLFSPDPKDRIITAETVRKAEEEEDLEIAREVMRDNREALRELGGSRITTEIVREVEDEMDLEDWVRLNPPK